VLLADLNGREAIRCCGQREFTLVKKEKANVALQDDTQKQKLAKWKILFCH